MIQSKKIKELAKKYNIDVCRITSSEKTTKNKSWLYERIEKNYITEFEEKNINKRVDPLLSMEDCRSIIVIGLSYNVENKNEKKYKLKGKISKSSWGIDYHIVLKEKMDLLIKDIKNIKNFKSKAFVDTGPLIDRELAARSGLGYFGKNCSIINPKYGSYIYIGYILTDLSLEFDSSIEEECGSCDLCIRACPTGALESSYRLNPKKCVSYLTQTKKEIPKEYREKMGIKIYGCDTCQVVCPKNKDIPKSQHDEFQPRVTGGYFQLEELMKISNKEFKNKYGHISASWRGKNLLKRNAIIALGNIKQMDNLKVLEDELKSDSIMIKEYSKWAINKIKDQKQR